MTDTIFTAQQGQFCSSCKSEKRQSCVKIADNWTCKPCLDKAMFVVKVAEPYRRYNIVKKDMTDNVFCPFKMVISIEEDGLEFFSGQDSPDVEKKLEMVCEALNLYDVNKGKK